MKDVKLDSRVLKRKGEKMTINETQIEMLTASVIRTFEAASKRPASRWVTGVDAPNDGYYGVAVAKGVVEIYYLPNDNLRQRDTGWVRQYVHVGSLDFSSATAAEVVALVASHDWPTDANAIQAALAAAAN